MAIFSESIVSGILFELVNIFNNWRSYFRAFTVFGLLSECRYDEVADPHQMFDIDAGIVRDCAPGTIFDKSICTCDYAPEPFRKGIQDG